MIRRAPVKGTDTVKVTFTVPRDGHVEPMAVVGNFNDWDPTANPLAQRGEACTATVVVGSGRRYAFRYLAGGGEWFNDEAADAYESNGMGEDNSVVDLTG